VKETAILITNSPSPYRIPLFNVLHEELGARGIGFRVLFGALGYAHRQWRVDMRDCLFPYDVLPSSPVTFLDAEGASFNYRGLLHALQREQPGVIVTNGFSIATTKVYLRSMVRRTPYLIWSGAIRNCWETESWLRRLQRTLLIRQATGFVAYGSRARDYLVELGAPLERVSIGINTVDTAHFRRVPKDIDAGREQDGKKRLLFVGHLTPRKGVDRLLRIVQLLARKRRDFVLDIVGSGSEQSSLQTMSHSLGIDEYVCFVGFKQKTDIPYYLHRASCFVFPTNHDIWGLALVEAMAAGLPCISSLNAGATYDLIQDGETGFAVDFSEMDNVAEKLHWLLDHPSESERLGMQAMNFIEKQVTLKKSAEGFVAAIEAAFARDK